MDIETIKQIFQGILEILQKSLKAIKTAIEKRTTTEVFLIIPALIISFCLIVEVYTEDKPIKSLLSKLASEEIMLILIGSAILLIVLIFLLAIINTISPRPKFLKWLFFIIISIITTVSLIFYIKSYYLSIEEINDQISWGEEYLIKEDKPIYKNPEATIYRNNIAAILQNKKPIKISVVVPINRDNGIFDSKEILTGVAIAQEEWNKSKKKKVLIGIADEGHGKHTKGDCGQDRDEGACKIAKMTAEKLIKKDVIAVIGHFSSDSTEVAAEVYQKHNIIAVSPTSTAVRTNNDECNIKSINRDKICLNSNIFRTSLDDSINSDILVETIEKINKKDFGKPIKKIAIIYESDSFYSKLFKKYFRDKIIEEYDKTIIADTPKCDISKSFKPEDCFLQIKEQNADTILLVPSTKRANLYEENVDENYIRKILNLNQENKHRLLGADSMYKYSFANKQTENMVVIVPWHRENKDCTEEKDSLRLECKAAEVFYSGDKTKPYGISWRTATSYDATQTILYSWQDYDKIFNRITLKNFKDFILNKIKKGESIIENGASDIPIYFNEDGDRRRIEKLGVAVYVAKDKDKDKFKFQILDLN